MKRSSFHLAAVAALLPGALAAQAHDHVDDADHVHPADHAALHATSELSPAHEQIETVRHAVEQFASPDAARAGGFRPVLGLIPTMGTHWVSVERMRSRAERDLERPEHLMFSPVNGEQRLVGVAFAYQARPGESRPDLFAGDLDAWHTHPEISPPGQELTMLHVWFVASPDGPFAGHNPFLPYWAVGLTAPDASRLADGEDSRRIRALALALAETVELGQDDTGLLRRFADAVRARTEPERDRIRALIPRLVVADSAEDEAAWNEAADAAIAEWEQIRAQNLAAIPFPALRDRLEAFYGEMLGEAHVEHAH
ncbi:MAG: hypothetical protein FJ207_07800 [Gemmatimonadetes bacterium]|nr:hypothetical protein [Gemmatimonadota bacterium]